MEGQDDMGKSEEVLIDSIKKEMRRQFVDAYNFLNRYVDDEYRYNQEILTPGSDLDLTFNRVGELAAWRKSFALEAPTADITTLAARLDELATPAPVAEEPVGLDEPPVLPEET
jgi:hypothetical protein